MTSDTKSHHVHDFNPLVSPHRENPHLFYEWSRNEQPVVYSDLMGAWMVTRYEDLKAIVSDPETFSSTAIPTVWQANPPEVLEALEGCLPEAKTMIDTDPPFHTPMRRAYERAFNRRRIRALEPEMIARANELIDGFIENRHAELVDQLATPYVRYILNLAMGIPKEDIWQVHQWGIAFMKVALPAVVPVDEKLEAVPEYKMFEEYVKNLLIERQADPRNDLASDLIHGTDTIDPLSFDDAVYTFRATVSAGFETTCATIGSTVLALMEHRKYWEESVDNPRVLTRVIEETLRRDAPHRGLMRVTTRDVEISGRKLPAGSNLLLLFGSGNRDDEKFSDPDSFDIDRPNVREHLAFGHGIHHCPGAPLARQEVLTVLTVLRDRIPELRLAAGYEPTYEPTYFFRSPQRVDVVW